MKLLLLFLFVALPSAMLHTFAHPYVPLASTDTTVMEVTQTQLPKRLERKYKRDAARLALRMDAQQQQDLRYQSIRISKELVEIIYGVLHKIYFYDEMAQSLADCNIHTYPNPSIDHFKIIFEKEVAWAAPLQQGVSETNSPSINELLDKYDLILENHEKWTDTEDIIVVRSKEPLNMAALANEFYNIEGVVEIDLGIPDISGNDILLERTQAGWRVEYLLTFGGAYAPGTGKQHKWVYEVSDSGDVQFLSDTGDAVPTYMKCKTSVVAAEK